MSSVNSPDEPKPAFWNKLIGTIGTALGVMERTADGAFKSTSPFAPLISIATIVGIIALVLGFVACIAGWASGKEGAIYAGLAFGGFAILCVIVPLLVIKPGSVLVHKPDGGSTQPTHKPTGEAQWSRIVPKVPILPEERLETFQKKLGELRSHAVKVVNDARKDANLTSVSEEHVRVNVFLVSTERVTEFGEVCGLFIPKSLYYNMASSLDRTIQFRPHEGLTGRTFTLGKPGGAKASLVGEELKWAPVPIPADTEFTDGEWQSFILSPEQTALIRKELRWIVSFPLRYPGSGKDKTFGVLNIDGLVEELDSKHMDKLYHQLKDTVKALTIEFADLPKVRISIQVDDPA